MDNMPLSFEPRLDILSESQRELWPDLDAVPSDFVLYGGTALALQLGQRISEDFDFFLLRWLRPESAVGSLQARQPRRLCPAPGGHREDWLLWWDGKPPARRGSAAGGWFTSTGGFPHRFGRHELNR
ncbi:MAG: nucleotidyl transferase AbiEii/AbiGii toxin family protein [Bryobacteraceae bacterium]|nr:nucleotidyl transferase AbiEii/AbiGii toxin family protein [Bryobacteraceae bacterium]